MDWYWVERIGPYQIKVLVKWKNSKALWFGVPKFWVSQCSLYIGERDRTYYKLENSVLFKDLKQDEIYVSTRWNACEFQKLFFLFSKIIGISFLFFAPYQKNWQMLVMTFKKLPWLWKFHMEKFASLLWVLFCCATIEEVQATLPFIIQFDC